MDRNRTNDMDNDMDMEIPEVDTDTGLGNQEDMGDTSGSLGGEAVNRDDSNMGTDDLGEMEDLDDSDLL